MRTGLLITLLLFTLACRAQNTIKVENGIATRNGVQWLMVSTTPIDSTRDKVILKSLAGDTIAKLSFIRRFSEVYFIADLPTVLSTFEFIYPTGTAIKTMLELFDQNKVIVDSRIDEAGLQKYCADNKLLLMKRSPVQEQSAADPNLKTAISFSSDSSKMNQPPDTSSLSAGTDRKSISFSLKNSSSKPVQYFIGAEPKSGKEAVSTIGGNSISPEHGKSGDKFCIMDKSGKAISCSPIFEGMVKIEINSAGTGFEKE